MASFLLGVSLARSLVLRSLSRALLCGALESMAILVVAAAVAAFSAAAAACHLPLASSFQQGRQVSATDMEDRDYCTHLRFSPKS